MKGKLFLGIFFLLVSLTFVGASLEIINYNATDRVIELVRPTNVSPSGGGGDDTNFTGISPINVDNINKEISITIDQSLTEGDTNSVASPHAILEYGSQPGKYQQFHDDFMFYSNSRTFGETNWLSTCTSTGATIGKINGESGHNGIITLSTGTTTTGFCTTYKATDSIYIAGGEVIEAVVRTNDYTNPAVDDYRIRVGLGDNNNADFTDGIYFEFSPNGAAGGNWVGKSANSGVRTSTTSLPVGGTGSPEWITLTATVNSTAGNVEFCFDYSNCEDINTNIPSGKTMEIRFQIDKNGVGTNSVDADLDAFGFRRVK